MEPVGSDGWADRRCVWKCKGEYFYFVYYVGKFKFYFVSQFSFIIFAKV